MSISPHLRVRSKGRARLRTLFCMSLGATLLGSLAIAVEPPRLANYRDSDATPMRTIYEMESVGKASDRRDAVRAWDETSHSLDSEAQRELYAALQWQAGSLMWKNTWLTIDALTADEPEPSVLAYEAARGSERLDVEGHRRMALWCANHGMRERSQAHWFAVLDLDRNDSVARKELGHMRIEGRWFTPKEIQAASLAAEDNLASIKKWMPRVQRWITTLEGQDVKKRLKVLEEVGEVSDPTILPAVAIAVPQVKTDTALHLVPLVRRFHSQSACNTLVQMAILGQSSEVREAAIQGLKKYQLEVFVPGLLDLISPPSELNHHIVTQPNGELVLQLVQERELRDRIEKNKIETVLISRNQTSMQTLRIDIPRDSLMLDRQGVLMINNPLAESVAMSESSRIAEDAHSAFEKANASKRLLQRSIVHVLRSTTGEDLGDDPKSWWGWWEHYEDSFLAGGKPVEVHSASYRDDSIYTTEEVEVVFVRTDCLVAGTPIQTEMGLKPIDTLRVGDRVVTQHIPTGEIRLKPVLRATQRGGSIARTLSLSNGETITATLGHRWWVIGKGWVKTKDLEPDMLLRTAFDCVEIKSLTEVEVPGTFNLMTEHDHTYFVGESRALSFDASEVIPTFQVVPGFPATQGITQR